MRKLKKTASELFELWLPVLAWAGVIFCLSGIPYLKTPFKFDFILRKTAHVAEYFIFTFLLWRAFTGSFNMGRRSIFIDTAVIAVLYAASDELHQLSVRGRHGSVWDILIDLIGILAFFLIINFILDRWKK